MPQSLSANYLHLIFSTKNRQPFLKDRGLREEMHAFLGGASKLLDCAPILAGGVEDHIHLLARFSRTITVADWVKEIKRTSSQWIKGRDPSVGNFSWQSGYGVFSVSASNVEKVKDYIARQEEHHQRSTFQDEFRTLLKKHQIEWDERYVWD